MKIYMNENVYSSAVKRINRIFDDFKNVVVSFSGGKDSTVCLELCLAIARQRNRLPLKVMFIDQEVEWQHTIDYVKRVMYRKDVEPIWLQMPIQLFNATSHSDEWLWCWKEGEKWVREKDPISIHENKFGETRFSKVFDAVKNYYFPNEDCANIGGIRSEESPKRLLAVTGSRCWKEMTFGKVIDKDRKHITFYPIYDWSYTDVWKFIFDNKVDYNRIYDFMYSKGVSVNKMRVSNLNHETALDSLHLLQELEPETWNKVALRLGGVNTEKHCRVEDCIPETLPEMFKSWNEYIFYLIEHIVKDEHKKLFKDKFVKMMYDFDGFPDMNSVYRCFVRAVVLDDYYFTTIENFYQNPNHRIWKKVKNINIKEVEKWE